MSMFDTVRCEYPLPDPEFQTVEFQTKDLRRQLDEYTITADGYLVHHEVEYEWLEEKKRYRRVPFRDVEVPYHGEIRLFWYNTETQESAEYYVTFDHGKVQKIECTSGHDAFEQALEDVDKALKERAKQPTVPDKTTDSGVEMKGGSWSLPASRSR